MNSNKKYDNRVNEMLNAFMRLNYLTSGGI